MAGDGERGRVAPNQLLKGWKEIAGFFGKDESTARRWASTTDMPVHRVPGRQRAAVYAYSAELDAWLRRVGGGRDGVPAAEAAASGPTGETAPADPVPAVTEASLAPAGGWRRPRSRRLALGIAGGLAFLAVLAGLAGWSLLAGGHAERIPDPAARELYLQGVFQWEKRTPESLARAVDLFNRAVEIDPSYAQAYGGLANTYNLMREYSTMPSGKAYAAAAAAARRAVEIDPEDADAQSALAFAEFYGLRHLDDGIARFEVALRLDPASPKIRQWYANALLHLGRFQDALAEIDEARRLDPASRSILASKGLALFCVGRSDEAVALLTELARTEPELMSPRAYLAFIYLAQGNYPAFLDALGEAGRLRGDPSRTAVAVAGRHGLAEGGFEGMVAAMLGEERRQYQAGRTVIYNVARFEALSGDWQSAVASLSASLKADEEYVMMLNIDPAFRLIRANPEFRRFAAGFGLPIVQ